jgi:site-specific DNA-methyltransferase (adenine-specific)
VNRIVHGDNLQVLETLPREHARLIYIDPPFNTGRTQSRQRMQVRAAARGERKGFGGRRYDSAQALTGLLVQEIFTDIRSPGR